MNDHNWGAHSFGRSFVSFPFAKTTDGRTDGWAAVFLPSCSSSLFLSFFLSTNRIHARKHRAVCKALFKRKKEEGGGRRNTRRERSASLKAETLWKASTPLSATASHAAPAKRTAAASAKGEGGPASSSASTSSSSSSHHVEQHLRIDRDASACTAHGEAAHAASTGKHLAWIDQVLARIIPLAFGAVAQRLVRLANLLELLRGLLVVRVLIGMPDDRELAVRLFDIVVACVFIDA